MWPTWLSGTDRVCASFSWLLCTPREDSAVAASSPIRRLMGTARQSTREHVRMRLSLLTRGSSDILLLMSVSRGLHSRIGIVSCVVWLVHGVTYQGNEDIFLKAMSKHETSRLLTSLQLDVAWEFIHHDVCRRRSHLFRPGVRECSWWSCFWWVEMPH
jgi:hypothetical protein